MPKVHRNQPHIKLSRNKRQIFFFIGVLLFTVLLLILNSTLFVYLDNTPRTAEEPLPVQNYELGNHGSGSDFEINSRIRNGGDNDKGNISLAFFYDPDCPCTYDAMAELMEIEIKYKNINQFWYNLSDPSNKTLWIDFMDINAYNVPNETKSDTPFLFVGDYYFHHE